MNAANIRRVSTYGGVDIYIEEDEGGEESELYREDFSSWMSSIGDEAYEDAKNGPPEVDKKPWRRLTDFE